MAILDLDKIVINKTIIGITCPVCSGNLILISKPAKFKKISRIISFTVRSYKCEVCDRSYKLF